ncbi:B3 DNA binding domain containing protein [Parasponia andersonii]|uniref:B3 DNA binding domain containing protein n=1 Tax=Parasponia andersonii TaxID=3476 RepID=A0A2P5CMR1_PARAD|nr:B3 DNA binding domain containing protein [Parasponia andersonii]
MTRGFKSKNPFFKVVMQPSYVLGDRLKIPSYFAMKHLRDKSGLVNLKVLGGKIWSVAFTFRVYGESLNVQFYKGWKVFSQENNLDIGDVCIFVMTKDREVSFEVTIFRAKENASSPTYKGGGIQISPNSDDETRILVPPDFPMKQASGGISTPQTCPGQEGIQRQRPPTPYENPTALKRTCVKSDNPIFQVVLQPTHTHSNSYLPVPFKFAKKYINKNQRNVILEVPGESVWSAKCIIGNQSVGLYTGWSAFAVENNLVAGDVCFFELVTETK